MVRTKLQKEFTELIDKPLILLIAPSGYGKTTLLHNYLDNCCDKHILWFSMSNPVIDEIWIWRKFCQKCGEISEELEKQLLQINISDSTLDMEYLREIFVNNITEPSCIVIDDFQNCFSERFNKIITYMVYEGIPNFSAIIISRVYPQIPYGEMLVRGYCGIIDQNDMTISIDETLEVFNINGVDLSEEELDEIYQYTDGWISAVYLALYDYLRNGVIGTYSSISHLMKTVIFDKLSDEIKEIYTKMSILDKFTYDEAVYIAETDISRITLSEAAENYGFMEYDPKSKSYHMHTMLKAVAASELENRKLDKSYLYNRAGDWYLIHERYTSAVMCFWKASNFDGVMSTLSGKYESVIMDEIPIILSQIISEAPMEIKINYPNAWLGYIYNVIIRMPEDNGEKLFTRAYNAFKQSEINDSTILGEFKFIEGLLEVSDLERKNLLFIEARDLLNGKSSGICNQILLTYGTPMITMMFYHKSGELRAIVDLEMQMARNYQPLIGISDGNWDELFEAEYLILIGDYKRAGEIAEQVQKKAKLYKQICVEIASYYIQFRSIIYAGDSVKLNDKIKEFDMLCKSLSIQLLVIEADLITGYLNAMLGIEDSIPEWIRNFNLERCCRMVRNVRSGCSAYGMLLCKTGRWNDLDYVSSKMLVPYERIRYAYVEIRGYIFKSIAAFNLEGITRASEYLKHALELAEPDEVREPFIENAIELLPIMEAMVISGKFASSLKPYLKNFQKSYKAITAGTDKVSLTEREIQMMKLVKDGYRNIDISLKLNIALVTVEKTLTSIYRKLDVNNRVGALSKWEQLCNRQ